MWASQIGWRVNLQVWMWLWPLQSSNSLAGAATTQGHVLTIGVEEEDARLCRILLCSSGDTHLLAEEKWVRSSPHHLQHWNSRAMPLDISLQVNPTPFPEVGYLPLERKWEIYIPVKSQKVDEVVQTASPFYGAWPASPFVCRLCLPISCSNTWGW